MTKLCVNFYTVCNTLQFFCVPIWKFYTWLNILHNNKYQVWVEVIRDFFLWILWHFCDILLWRDWFQKGEVLSLSQPPTSWLHWQLLSKTYLIISIFNFRFLLFTSTFYFFRPKFFSVFTSNLESKSSSSLVVSDQNLSNLLWNPVLIRKKLLKMKNKLWTLLLRGR